MQITPATQEVVSRQNVHKAVAEAQRHGMISICANEENIELLPLTAGQNHPVRIPQQLTMGMQPPPAPTSAPLLKTTGKKPWPTKHGSGSSRISTIHHTSQGSSGTISIRPIVVPKIVSNPTLPVQPGYQEAHKLYDEMRQFFAQKAMSVHGGEVVVIKVTLMSWKPGNRNPSIVSVSKQVSMAGHSNSNLESTEHIRNNR